MWIKYVSPLVILLAGAFAGQGQYYYKDIVVTGQISSNYRVLKAGKVSTVAVLPSESGGGDGREGVNIDQTLFAQQNLLVTHTKTPDATESWLKSYYNDKGSLVKTTDSSVNVMTVSKYQYNDAGQLTSITSTAVSKDNPAETEVHIWTYNANGKPTRMLKVKDNYDTTFVSFEPDEQGNAAAEKVVRKKGNLGTTYYYYDAKGQLTDVARYNKKADRILPNYIFEYNETGQVTQMIIVPEGSSDYQTWKYLYDQQGLKQQDLCYSKQKELLGKIIYQYQFAK